MRCYPVKITQIIKSIFNKWIWSFDTEKKEVYITFDDGPVPEITPWVVEQLKKHNAKATFFCIADNIQKHPNIYKLLQKEGHRIGNHTYNHLKGWNTNKEAYIQNTLKAECFLNQNKQSKLFRPPYGRITNNQSKALRSLGYKIIMWDVLSADFDKNLTAKDCQKNVLDNVTNGSIVVFHDSYKAYPRLKETLPKVLEELSNRGFTFKTIH